MVPTPPAHGSPGHDARGQDVESLLRPLVPRVVAALVRRYDDFDGAEDATQEALLEATVSWPAQGVPDNPTGWLVRVASRRLIDRWRSDSARRRRETLGASQVPHHPAEVPDDDDTLTLIFLCCHPALSPSSQVALTLRAVAGLSTAEVAAALLVPETTVGQRISRAKATIRDTGARFELPSADDIEHRTQAVLVVLYLVFNEGHASSRGGGLHRPDLTAEAMRLARELLRLRPHDHEVPPWSTRQTCARTASSITGRAC